MHATSRKHRRNDCNMWLNEVVKWSVSVGSDFFFPTSLSLYNFISIIMSWFSVEIDRLQFSIIGRKQKS